MSPGSSGCEESNFIYKSCFLSESSSSNIVGLSRIDNSVYKNWWDARELLQEFSTKFSRDCICRFACIFIILSDKNAYEGSKKSSVNNLFDITVILSPAS